MVAEVVDGKSWSSYQQHGATTKDWTEWHGEYQSGGNDVLFDDPHGLNSRDPCSCY